MVLLSSRADALAAFDCFGEPVRSGGAAAAPRHWANGPFVFSTPEGLRSLCGDYGRSLRPAAVVLVDPGCLVHQARGAYGRRSQFAGTNDRPQHVAEFRRGLAVSGWSPPLLVMTGKPAKSANTLQMLSPFCLDAW